MCVSVYMHAYIYINSVYTSNLYGVLAYRNWLMKWESMAHNFTSFWFVWENFRESEKNREAGWKRAQYKERATQVRQQVVAVVEKPEYV